LYGTKQVSKYATGKREFKVSESRGQATELTLLTNNKIIYTEGLTTVTHSVHVNLTVNKTL